MPTKQFYATGDFRYGTRMLRAGDGPVEMDGPTARLFTALKKISPTAPKPTSDALVDKTKAELVTLAGLTDAEAKKLKKADIIALIESK